jgi:hypothetical protein
MPSPPPRVVEEAGRGMVAARRRRGPDPQLLRYRREKKTNLTT